MYKIAGVIGLIWIGIIVSYGVWLGVSGLFWGASGIFFQSGSGDMWILAILTAPGYFLWKWANAQSKDQE